MHFQCIDQVRTHGTASHLKYDEKKNKTNLKTTRTNKKCEASGKYTMASSRDIFCNILSGFCFEAKQLQNMAYSLSYTYNLCKWC